MANAEGNWLLTAIAAAGSRADLIFTSAAMLRPDTGQQGEVAGAAHG